MSRQRASALLGAATVAAAALLVPSAASADQLQVPDGHRDYWHDHRADGDTPDQHRPDWGDPDILRTVYRHRHDRVSVRIEMARLQRRDGGYWRVEVSMRTGKGLRRTASWFKPFDSSPSTEWSGPGSCAIEGRIDFAQDALIIDVPRRCLRHPRRVAFRSTTRWWPTSDDVAYLDVSGESGYETTEWSAPVPRG